VFVDECHATGFVGATGRGTDEYWGVSGQVDIINSTLGKALGGATGACRAPRTPPLHSKPPLSNPSYPNLEPLGGYTTGRGDVVALLRQKARPYLFSNTLAPSVAAASLEVFRMLEGDSSLRDTLAANTRFFRAAMTDAGFAIKESDHPIVVRAGVQRRHCLCSRSACPCCVPCCP